jgi:Preprotein translocase subunit YajC
MFFDSIAHAMGSTGGAGAEGGNPITAFLPLILMFAIFYFLLIRPQQKKAKQHKECWRASARATRFSPPAASKAPSWTWMETP